MGNWHLYSVCLASLRQCLLFFSHLSCEVLTFSGLAYFPPLSAMGDNMEQLVSHQTQFVGFIGYGPGKVFLWSVRPSGGILLALGERLNFIKHD